jgi:hypothetical protein
MNASTLQLVGAGCYGAVVGWFLYHVNRYRRGDVQLTDLVTVIGAVGGGAILKLFPAKSDFFGAYGIGLAGGFFAYLIVLAVLAWSSDAFGREWFLDGRRQLPQPPWYVPEEGRGSGTAMGDPGPGNVR